MGKIALANTRIEIREGLSLGLRDLQADVFLAPSAVANQCAVILVHGGGWFSGDRRQLRAYGILLAQAGFTCMAVEYRLAPAAHWPAQVDDVDAAGRWFAGKAEEFGFDPQRIAISGNSAGGHLALMSVIHASDWQPKALAAFYPPCRVVAPGEKGHDQAFADLMGPENSAAACAAASPLALDVSGFPPTMLITGTADTRVPAVNTIAMHKKLRDAGCAVELHVFEGLDHAFDAEPAYAKACASLLALFFQRHL